MSARAAPGLTVPCCLRCAKRLGQESDLVCEELLGSTKCSRYTSIHKDCDPVPESVVELANALLSAAATHHATYSGDKSAEAEASQEELVALQTYFTKRAEVAVRLERRKEPKTMIEVGLALLESNRRIEALLGDLVALGRAEVSLFAVSLLSLYQPFLGVALTTCQNSLSSTPAAVAAAEPSSPASSSSSASTLSHSPTNDDDDSDDEPLAPRRRSTVSPPAPEDVWEGFDMMD